MKTVKKTFKKTKMSAADIKQKVEEMKQDRLKKKEKEAKIEKERYNKNRDQLRQIHEKLRYEKLTNPNNTKKSYTDIKTKSMGIPTWDGPKTKITLDALNNMHYSDFNINDEDDFNPTDIQDDDEIRELNKKKKIFNKKNKSITKMSGREKPLEEKLKNITRRGVQHHQSQMSGHRHNNTMDPSRGVIKSINNAYNYAQGKVPPKKGIVYAKARDERSVPRLAQSLEGGNVYKNAYPKSKQAMINQRLTMGGSQLNNPQNKSVHYRRNTHGGNSSLTHSYHPGPTSSKAPYLQQQMKNRVKEIESSSRAKERQNMDGIMLMQDNHISKGLKTIDKDKYRYS